MTKFARLDRLPPYVFATVNEIKMEARRTGKDIIDLGMGNPDLGTPLPPHSGIRVGDHKLIWNWHGRLELYNLAADSQEKHDLSNEKPELVTQLHQQLKTWLKQNVAPRYWPKRDETVSPEDAGGPFPFRDLR